MPEAIPREDWQDPHQQVTGPRRREPFRQGIVHYRGGDFDGAPSDIGAALRNMQAAYLRLRHYSLGYGYAVVSDAWHPEDGSVWEIRGSDLNMASNPGGKWNKEGRQPAGNVNNWTGSVLILGDETLRATPAAAGAISTLFAQWHTEAGTTPQRPWPHGEVDATPCCGLHYQADIAAGLFDPVPSPPVPPPPTEDDPMLYIATPAYPGHDAHSEWWAVFASGVVRRAVNSDVTYADSHGVPLVPQDSQEHDAYLRSIAIRPGTVLTAG